MKIERIKEKVLEQHYPEEDELKNLERKYQRIARFIQKEFDRETHFAGSASRKTCLAGDRDIDVFVLFPESVSEQELEEEGLEIGKSVFEKFDGDHHIEYAEHPYTKGKIDGHEVEIVPCYDADPENIKSSVDRTPHHSRWVEENLEEIQDVVILKKFLKSGDLYGSSLKMRGFSGYLCEVLIQHYGCFEELVSLAPAWPERKFVDPEDHHSGSLPETLEKKFEADNLVVIDPVDPERNVASVLSKENYSKFIYLCWRFRNSPGMKFFEEEDRDYTEFELKQEVESRGDFLVLEFETPDEVDDIVYPQMRKSLRRIEEELHEHGFRIFESGFHVGERTRIFFELQQELPDVEQKRGPKVFHGEEHLAQFTSKYDNVFVQEDRLTAKVEREYRDAKEFLDNFLEGDLQEKGIPGKVAEEMEAFSYTDPLQGDEKWLKYLGEKLHVK